MRVQVQPAKGAGWLAFWDEQRGIGIQQTTLASLKAWFIPRMMHPVQPVWSQHQCNADSQHLRVL